MVTMPMTTDVIMHLQWRSQHYHTVMSYLQSGKTFRMSVSPADLYAGQYSGTAENGVFKISGGEAKRAAPPLPKIQSHSCQSAKRDF